MNLRSKPQNGFARILAVLSFTWGLFPLQTGAQNIVQNGSFEIVHFVPYSVPPWAPVPTLSYNWPNAPDGRNYADVVTLSQTLSTTPGQAYRLTFDAAGDLYYGPTTTVQVDWAGATAAAFTTQPHPYDPTQNRFLQIVWEQFSLDLTANTTSSLLTFSAQNGSVIELDDVRVVAVPEPLSLWLVSVGVLAMMPQLRRCLKSPDYITSADAGIPILFHAGRALPRAAEFRR
jgi:hypothetical protein